jgi:short-subunit dehydrogenase
MNNVLIIGASSGLGQELARQYLSESGFNVITVARSSTKPTISNEHIQADMSNPADLDDLVVKLSNRSYSVVIYCASAWGESREFKAQEVQKFIDAGPMGFLGLIERMVNNQCLTNLCSIISIGSTATLKNNSVLYGSNSPVYAMAKEMQRFVSFELQRKLLKKGISVTTLTLGGLGEERIKSNDIFQIINCFHSLSPECRPVELIMPSQGDFEG